MTEAICSVTWNWNGVLFCVCTFCLLGVALADWRTLEIPPLWNLLLGILGILHLLLDQSHWDNYLTGMLLAGGILLTGYLITGGGGIGGGDIKLMAAAGVLLGEEKVLLALIIGSLSAAFIHPVLIKRKRKGGRLAFGPYLCLGIFVAMTYGDQILTMFFSFFIGLLMHNA